MDSISEIFAPRSINVYNALNRQDIPPGLDRYYRPADYVKVDVEITAVLWLLWHQGHQAQHLLIPYNEDWILARKSGTELISQAKSHIARRCLSPILWQLPSQLQPQAQYAGVSLTIWDSLKLGSEMLRVADLFANRGRYIIP